MGLVQATGTAGGLDCGFRRRKGVDFAMQTGPDSERKEAFACESNVYNKK